MEDGLGGLANVLAFFVFFMDGEGARLRPAAARENQLQEWPPLVGSNEGCDNQNWE